MKIINRYNKLFLVPCSLFLVPTMVLAGQASWNAVPGGKVVNGQYQLKCGEGSGWQKCGKKEEVLADVKLLVLGNTSTFRVKNSTGEACFRTDKTGNHAISKKVDPGLCNTRLTNHVGAFYLGTKESVQPVKKSNLYSVPTIATGSANKFSSFFNRIPDYSKAFDVLIYDGVRYEGAELQEFTCGAGGIVCTSTYKLTK